MRYVKITQTDGKKYFLRVNIEGPKLISGIEVDKHGEEISPSGYDNRLRIVEKKLIKSMVEYRMNNHYATLEKGATNV